jgi:hypothetical protein
LCTYSVIYVLKRIEHTFRACVNHPSSGWWDARNRSVYIRIAVAIGFPLLIL